VKDRGGGAGMSDGSIVGIMQVGTGRGRDVEMEHGTWEPHTAI
jgi:hypothetical protein